MYASSTLRPTSTRQHNAYVAWALMDGPLTVVRSMMRRGFSIGSIRLMLYVYRHAKGI